MPITELERRLEGWITALMKDGRAPLLLRRGGSPLPLRVVPRKTSGPDRPDGLREGAPTNAGFSFAVAEAELELDATGLARAALDAAHDVLNRAGMDDWMEYTHLGKLEPAAIDANPILGLRFSSALKGAGVVVMVLEALGIPEAEVTT